MKIELVEDARASIGESPLWVPQEETLYWADIKAPCLFARKLTDDSQRRWVLPADIGGFALDGRGRALVALRTGLHWLSLDTGRLALAAPAPFDPALIRFNESGCDSTGRFWVGVMTDPLEGRQTDRKGALYSYKTAEGLRAYPDFAEITNSMAWSADEQSMYLSHSEERVIYRYLYDREIGALGERRVFARQPGPGIPDGAAMDEEGHLWCANHGGFCLHRYAPDGALAATIALPVSQPTKCCFAGKALDWLYITSAREGLDDAALAREPQAGGLFRLRPGPRGLERHWRVR